jgi:RNA polymerase sigma factor (sigma-70 family)
MVTGMDSRGARPDSDSAIDQDARLVLDYLDGVDPTAWDRLLDRYAWLIQAVIRRYHLSAEDEADVYQDVCLAFWHELPRLRDRGRIGPWLTTVTGRRAWDTRRRLARELVGALPSDDADELSTLERIADRGPGPEERVEHDELRHAVRAAIEQLTPRWRELVEALYFGDGGSYAEIAARLGYSMNSIGPIRGRCLQELRQLLGEHRAS